jgi:hypothetical protein
MMMGGGGNIGFMDDGPDKIQKEVQEKLDAAL